MSHDDELARLLASRGWLSPEAWEAWQRARAAGQAADLASFLRAAQLVDPAQLDAALRELASPGLRSSLVSASGDSTLGRYELLRELGRGGFGVVYLGRSPDGREVAIKVLLNADDEAVSRFDREARVLKSLSEEGGFVPLEDWGQSKQGPYLVMPYISGGSLAQRLSKEGPLEVEEGVGLIAEVSRDIGRAHEQGVIHRDIKPANILFNEAGQPLLTDLGLARRFGQAPGLGSVSLSVTGQAMGTPGYMAPEQMLDAKGVGPQADVFGLAATLYKALTGSRPYEAESALEMMGLQARGELRPLADFGIAAPGLELVLARALSAEPSRRPADGQALALALEAVLDGAPPRRAPLALIGLLLLLLAAGLGWALWPPGVAEAPAEVPEEAPAERPATVATLELVEVLTGGVARFPGRVAELQVSPDGASLAGAGQGPVLRVWDAQTLAPTLGADCSPSQSLFSLAFAPGGEAVYAGGDDGVVTEVALASGEVIRRFGPIRGIATSIGVAAEGRLLAVSESGSGAWDLATGEALGPLAGLERGVNVFILAEQGRVFYGGAGAVVLRLDAVTGERLGSWDLGPPAGGLVTSLAVIDDGQTLLAATRGGFFKVPLVGAEPPAPVPYISGVAGGTMRGIVPLEGAQVAFLCGNSQLFFTDESCQTLAAAWPYPEVISRAARLRSGDFACALNSGLIRVDRAPPAAAPVASTSPILELRRAPGAAVLSLDRAGVLLAHDAPAQPVYELGEEVLAAALSEDGKRLVVGGASRAGIVDLETREARLASPPRGLKAACWIGGRVLLFGDTMLTRCEAATEKVRGSAFPSAAERGVSAIDEERIALFVGEDLILYDPETKARELLVRPDLATRIVDFPGPLTGVVHELAASVWELEGREMRVRLRLEMPQPPTALALNEAGDFAVAAGALLRVRCESQGATAELRWRDAGEVITRLRWVGEELLIGTASGLVGRARLRVRPGAGG